jgi:4-hydroxythreonine-4-phosphate dehydrogenase
MVRYITEGIDLALAGRIQAVTTCPINKAAMHQAGFSFPGHTELFAERTGTTDYVMMLAGSKLRVALVTIHVALEEVVHRLTSERILRTIRITHEALVNAFGIPTPRLAVAAVNPHGGEGGAFGNQEGELILPAVTEAVAAGIGASGPYPADTLFYRALQGEWDAVICMYHDQGLIPFKMIHFTDGVNTTLGLPIVRTSVDHGTAYDIARTGRADAGSLMAAIGLAARQATLRQSPTLED